ncbi:MAG: pilus assembly protein PilM [Planctomycetia bacterium]|nr:pilus assembly protein PilM [Planctomycetia bacterium]
MISLKVKRGVGPIGVDVGSRWIKVVQLSDDRARVVAATRLELARPAADKAAHEKAAADKAAAQKSAGDKPDGAKAAPQPDLAETLREVRESHDFHGKEAVLCLSGRDLFVQNIRVARGAPGGMDAAVRQEVAGRLPFDAAQADIRYLEAGDVRQGEQVKREAIVIACRRDVVRNLLETAERAGLRPIALDVEPCAIVRTVLRSFRRDEDRAQTLLIAHVGASESAVIITRGEEPVFVKYLDIGGKHFDEAVARTLDMKIPEAASLRRNQWERRTSRQDPELVRTVGEAVRTAVDRLAGELSMCMRYYSVTFRGQPLERLVLGGGEATPDLAEMLSKRVGLPCETCDPWRGWKTAATGPRTGQWDVAVGLALREAAP